MTPKPKSSLFLREIDLIRIREIFQKHLPSATIYAYGSRVNGDAHDGSDLDLAILSTDGLEIPMGVLSKLRESLDILRAWLKCRRVFFLYFPSICFYL